MQLWDMTNLVQNKLVAMHTVRIMSNPSLQVNLTPRDRPADLYTTVAKMVRLFLPCCFYNRKH